MWQSHVVTDCVTQGGDVALRTNISPTVELVMALSVTMKACGPVTNMRVWDQLVVLGEG